MSINIYHNTNTAMIIIAVDDDGYQKIRLFMIQPRVLDLQSMKMRVGQTQHFSSLLVPNDTWLF